MMLDNCVLERGSVTLAGAESVSNRVPDRVQLQGWNGMKLRGVGKPGKVSPAGGGFRRRRQYAELIV